MDLVDVILLGGGVDDDLLEDILDTIVFIEGDEHGTNIGHDGHDTTGSEGDHT